MEIEITQGTFAGGAIRKAGEKVTVSDQDARLLINLGKAKVYEDRQVKSAPSNRKSKVENTRDAG